MKRLNIILLLVPVFLISSCEKSFEGDSSLLLLPASMSETVIAGSNTTRIMADFHYLPDSDLVDHITWSNHQIHYFSYDGAKRLILLRKLKVQEKVQEEFYFSYEGELVSEVLLVKRNLDYTYLEPIDSASTGRIIYENEGMQVISEREYGIQKDSNREVLVRLVAYEYDGGGNIISRKTSYPDGSDKNENVEVSYDSGKHPLSGLSYYFTGESFVNNPLNRIIDNIDYSYDITLNSENYPELIYEKFGSTHSRVFRYTYKTK